MNGGGSLRHSFTGFLFFVLAPGNTLLSFLWYMFNVGDFTPRGLAIARMKPQRRSAAAGGVFAATVALSGSGYMRALLQAVKQCGS
jgi:hypothetical protein